MSKQSTQTKARSSVWTLDRALRPVWGHFVRHLYRTPGSKTPFFVQHGLRKIGIIWGPSPLSAPFRSQRILGSCDVYFNCKIQYFLPVIQNPALNQFLPPPDVKFLAIHQLHDNSRQHVPNRRQSDEYGLFQCYDYYTCRPTLCARVSSRYIYFVLLPQEH